MKSFYKFFIAYLIFAVVIGTFGWLPNIAKAYTTVSDWKFDGSYLDSVGTHNGTANGTTISVANNYLSLTGAGADFVSVDDAIDLSFSSGPASDLPFTISAWVKTGTGSTVFIASKGTDTADIEYFFQINGGYLDLFLMDATHQVGNRKYATANLSALYPNLPIADTWIHVVATYDGVAAGTNVKFYLNGSAIPTTVEIQNTYTGMEAGTAPLLIGKRVLGGSTGYSEGAIDEMKIMSAELTPAEIGSIFNSEANKYRVEKINTTFLNADGNNVSTLSATAVTTKVTFTPVSQINTNDGIQIDFAADIDLTAVVPTDITVAQLNNGTDIAKGTAIIDGQKIQIPITTQGDMPSEQVIVTIANSHIITPADPNTYAITATTWDLGTDNIFGGVADTLEGTGTSAVVFSDTNSNVEISASVDPTLTLTLDTWYGEPPADPVSENGTPGTCVLGTLISTENRLCLYQATVDTNSAGGYTAFVRDSGNFASGTNEMADAPGTPSTPATISPGTEAYGIATSVSGYQIAQINDFDGGGVGLTDLAWLWTNRTQSGVNATAVTTNDQTFGGATGPVDNNYTILMHMVNISGITKAGSYTTTTIITVVGNF